MKINILETPEQAEKEKAEVKKKLKELEKARTCPFCGKEALIPMNVFSRGFFHIRVVHKYHCSHCLAIWEAVFDEK